MGWFLLVRAFTPLGAGLAIVGLCRPATRARAANATRFGWSGESRHSWRMAFLAEKLHHEYYWLLLAPVAAVGIGRALALARRKATVPARSRWPRLCLALRACKSARRGERPRNGTASSRGGCRCRGDGPGRSLGRRARGPPVSGRPSRLPHGVERRRGGASGRRVGSRDTRSKVRSIWSNTIAAGGSLFRRPGEPRRLTRGERACTTPSGDDTRSLWTVPMSSSPIWPIPRCTGMPTEVAAGHHS